MIVSLSYYTVISWTTHNKFPYWISTMAGSKENTPEPVDSPLLIGLRDETPRVKYTNMDDIRLLRETRATLCYSDNSQSPFIIVSNIPPTILQEFEILGTRGARSTSRTFVNEPDGSFTLPHHDWPILVIEAGVSKSDTKLQIDARGWLESARSGTKVAITININRFHPQIDFKRGALYINAKQNHSVLAPASRSDRNYPHQIF